MNSSCPFEMYMYFLRLWSVFLKDPHAIPWKSNHQKGQSQWKDNLNLPTSRHSWPNHKDTNHACNFSLP